MFLCIAAIGLVLAGLWLTAKEIAPFDFSYRVGQNAGALINEDIAAQPVSVEGNRVLLEICALRLQGISYLASPTGVKASIAEKCAELAAAATRILPTYAYAHYVSALAQLRLDRPQDAQDSLLLSQQLARNEQWISELRVALAEDNGTVFADYLQSAHLEDLALLAQSTRGVRSIARRYVASPLFRERITSVVETLPPEVQARFLQRVRAEAQAFTQAR